MITTILTIVATLASLAFYIYKKRETPTKQLELKLNENDKAIASGDVNLLLDSRLRNTRPNHPGK